MARSTDLRGAVPAPRLWLEPAGSPPAVVQGCWWPRSTDPGAELPGLLLALEELGGPVIRVRLSAAGWSRRPNHVEVAGRSVTVGYFSGQSTGLLTASCAGGAGLAVRVVPAAGFRTPNRDDRDHPATID